MLSPDTRRVFEQMRHVHNIKQLLLFRIEGKQAILEQASDPVLISRAQGAIGELRYMLNEIEASESAAKRQQQ